MEENNNKTTTTGFGITDQTKSQNQVGYDAGGFKKATLLGVVKEEIGKETKFIVLSFKFLDAGGIKKFTHSEFMIDGSDLDYNKKLEGMNGRIKHIYESFNKGQFIAGGIGNDATSFDDFFDKAALAFNTSGHNKGPIYKDEKGGSKLVWIKLGYYRKKNPTQIGFPLSPNFIEGINDATDAAKPKTLVINNQYDIIEQPRPAQQGTTFGGGAIHTGGGNSDTNEF